ncbi:MAG: AmmeMemoRadiSam system protein B [Proteobacteria bacterium]|nr:AmmeMemoRadiSam system protein B [Pseudomonadota bacterium]
MPASPIRARHTAPKALIAPHAGYVYSGAVAGTAYASLAPLRGRIRRVVLLGPSHRVPFRGLAVPTVSAFDSPLGAVPLDPAAIASILNLPAVAARDDAHAREHSLEVHLPFLQRALDEFDLVPIVVGDATPEAVDEVLAALWGGPETLIVVSSDLSHYHAYDEALVLDRRAGQAIEALRGDLLEDGQACGNRPIRGLLRRARALDLRATALDTRNSGDTKGDKSRVVGYGAYAFEYAEQARLSAAQREVLLKAAAQSLVNGLRTGRPAKLRLGSFPPQVEAIRASFVTLESGGALRGCIGSTQPRRPLIQDVVENAFKSGFSDRRFPKLEVKELDRMGIGISILSTPRAIDFDSEDGLRAALRPGLDGVVLTEGKRRGLFLPQVWASLPDAQGFVARLKQKAGLAPDHWSDEIRAFRFTAETFKGKLDVRPEDTKPT